MKILEEVAATEAELPEKLSLMALPVLVYLQLELSAGDSGQKTTAHKNYVVMTVVDVKLGLKQSMYSAMRILDD